MELAMRGLEEVRPGLLMDRTGAEYRESLAWGRGKAVVTESTFWK